MLNFGAGSLLTDGTEQTVASINVAGEARITIDLSVLASGDVVELRAYRKVLTSGTARLVSTVLYSGAIPTGLPLVHEFALGTSLAETDGIKITLKQTFGTYRTFDWRADYVPVISAAAIRAEMDANSTRLSAIETDTQDIQSRLPASLVGGLISASVAAFTAGAQTTLSNAVVTAVEQEPTSPVSGSLTQNVIDLLTRLDVETLSDWLIAMATAGATAPAALSSAGFVPSTDSLEAQANAPATFDVADIFEADPADYDADADSFAARFLGVVTQANLIGSAEIEVVAPVAATGRVTVYQGKDYAVADGTQLSWRSSSAINLTGASVTLDVDGEQFAAIVTGSAGAWTITVDLTAAQTAALAVGVYPYEVVAELSPSGRTPPPLVTGTLEVRGER